MLVALGCSSDPSGELEAEQPLDAEAAVLEAARGGGHLRWDHKAGTFRYSITRTSGFDAPGGPTTTRAVVSVTLDGKQRVLVSGDGLEATFYRFHPWRLCETNEANTVVQENAAILALPPFPAAPRVGRQHVSETHVGNEVTLQSRRTTRIDGVGSHQVAYTTSLAFRIPENRAVRDFASQFWGDGAADSLRNLEWLTHEWTPYGLCEGRFNSRLGVLETKRCVLRVLPDRGATLAQVLSDPLREEIQVERLSGP